MQDAPASLLRSFASLVCYALGALGIWLLFESFSNAAGPEPLYLGAGCLAGAVLGLLLVEALNRHERHMREIVVALQDLRTERSEHEAAVAPPREA